MSTTGEVKKILVTGATGTNGKQIAKLLLKECPTRVRVGVRDPLKVEDLVELGAEVTVFDYTDKKSMASSFIGVETVILLTAMTPTWEELVKDAVDAAKEAGVKFILRFSAAGANPEAPIYPGNQHGKAEVHVKNSGIDYAIIQPTFFMDNFINFLWGGIKAEGKIYGASGTAKISYIATEDISAVAAKILLNPEPHKGKTYPLTGPEALTDAEVAKLFADQIGKPVEYIDIPSDAYYEATLKNGMPEFVADGMRNLEDVKRAGYASAVSPFVEEILGRPAMKFKDFLVAHADRLK